MMSVSEEVLAENESDSESQLNETCPKCGAQLRDHYGAGGWWDPCDFDEDMGRER